MDQRCRGHGGSVTRSSSTPPHLPGVRLWTCPSSFLVLLPQCCWAARSSPKEDPGGPLAPSGHHELAPLLSSPWTFVPWCPKRALASLGRVSTWVPLDVRQLEVESLNLVRSRCVSPGPRTQEPKPHAYHVRSLLSFSPGSPPPGAFK